MYLSPCTGGSGVNSIAFDTTTRGQVVPVGCIDATNYVCTLTLTMPGSSNSYSARMRSVYDTAKLAISAQDTSNLAIEFKQSQTSIDVTAKANDIVRRLRVAVPLAEAKNLPEAVFQAFDGICKQLEVGADTSGNATIANNCF